MVSRYTNELNAFREGLEARTKQHQDKINAVNQALGIKADKVFENAKKLGDAGSKLLESGIGGGVGATAIGKVARKGITSFNKFRASRQAARDSAVSEEKTDGGAKQSVGGDDEEGTGNLGESENTSSGFGEESVDDIAARMKAQVFGRQTARESGNAEDIESKGGDVEGTDAGEELQEMRSVGGRSGVSVDDETMGIRSDTQPFTEETMQEGVERRGMAQEDIDAPEQPGQVKPKPSTDDETKLDVDDTETKTGDAGDAGDAGAEAGEGAEAGAEGAGEAAGEAGADVAGDVAAEAGAATAAEGLEDAALATSWLAWLGIPELLAGAGAIAGGVAAGFGIADAVKSSQESTQAEAMPTKDPNQPGMQVAGNYVVPTMDSLS